MTHERGAADALAEAAAAAGLAPSVHNTQPWRWRVHRTRLDLFAERSRQLGATDPDGRLLMISCGAALHHARIALAAEGWTATVTRFPDRADPDRADPDRADPDHLARITPDQHVGVTAEAMRIFQSARTRHSDRRPVVDTPVPREALAAVRAAVEAEQNHLHLLRPEQVSDLAVAAARAGELEGDDEALRAELRYWVGGTRPTGTGLPDTVIPSRPPASTVPQRDFGRAGTLTTGVDQPPDAPASAGGAEPSAAGAGGAEPSAAGADRAATYAVVFGEEDNPRAWLRAGEALSAAWLTASEHGVSLLPFTAPMEVAATRTILLRLLAGLGHPYLVVRVGLADPDHPGPPATPRLAPAQTVEIIDEPR